MSENSEQLQTVEETPTTVAEQPKKQVITKFCCNSGEDTNTTDANGNPIYIGKVCKPTTSGACFGMGWNKKFVIKCDSESIKQKLKTKSKKPPLTIKTGSVCKYIAKDKKESSVSGDPNGMNNADNIGLANDAMALGMGGKRRKNKSKKIKRKSSTKKMKRKSSTKKMKKKSIKKRK